LQEGLKIEIIIQITKRCSEVECPHFKGFVDAPNEGRCSLFKKDVKRNQKCLSPKPAIIGTRHIRLDSLDTNNPEHFEIIFDKMNLHPIRPEIIKILGESKETLRAKDILNLLSKKIPRPSNHILEHHIRYLSSLNILCRENKNQYCLTDLGKKIYFEIKNNVVQKTTIFLFTFLKINF
jgi:hypothetical protein